jgi:hypothetical protein
MDLIHPSSWWPVWSIITVTTSCWDNYLFSSFLCLSPVHHISVKCLSCSLLGRRNGRTIFSSFNTPHMLAPWLQDQCHPFSHPGVTKCSLRFLSSLFRDEYIKVSVIVGFITYLSSQSTILLPSLFCATPRCFTKNDDDDFQFRKQSKVSIRVSFQRKNMRDSHG